MFVQPGEWSNFGDTRGREARSIGAILGEMHEIARLRARRTVRPLRRNSA
ncbi:hypothetical protein [Sphingomonas gei]|nr:hypothetical protein [Sphingomonas gei]